VEVTNPAKSTIKKPYDAKSLTNSRRMAMVWKIKIIAILLLSIAFETGRFVSTSPLNFPRLYLRTAGLGGKLFFHNHKKDLQIGLLFAMFAFSY